MAVSKNNRPPLGKYVSRKDAKTLGRAQNKRSAFIFGSTLTLAVMLFVRQGWAVKSKELIWLQTLYVLMIAALVIVSVIASYGMLRGCKLNGEISEKYKPRAGFERRTFASLEWFMYLHFLLAAAQVALVIYGYDIGGLIAAALAAAGAVLAFLGRDVSYKTLKDDLIYLPPLRPEGSVGPRSAALDAENSGGINVRNGAAGQGGGGRNGSGEREKDGEIPKPGEEENQTDDFYGR